MNAAPPPSRGAYVLYWMQAFRRLDRNHALAYALKCAGELQKPLVVYEGLRLDYPWASPRIHLFLLQGMAENALRARELGLNYWPFVEREAGEGRGLLRRLAGEASLVVTDDYPCFVAPGQAEALARAVEVPVFAVDANSLVPLGLLGLEVGAAAHLRPRIHKAFAEAWAYRTAAATRVPPCASRRVKPRFELWKARDLGAFLAGLPLDPGVAPVPGVLGGRSAGKALLRTFLKKGLRGYAASRSTPRSPSEGHGSGLSPYLHFGHVGIEEVVEAVLGRDWTPEVLRPEARGRREGFFSGDEDVNAFLDQAIVWRDLGLHWHRFRRGDTSRLATALPAWAERTLSLHAGDPRTSLYSAEELEGGATHDPLWNAAQRELVATGQIHTYLRMLWGKKVLEWSRTPEEAYRLLVHLNNKYALDGRDPNSYTGILWCFGLFDRPWAPERPVFGRVRYMSSENTARKFRLGPYYDYIAGLPPVPGLAPPAPLRGGAFP
jgi:deoxyribodipyrimidine photo-lyase